jgi:hypothetical protein
MQHFDRRPSQHEESLVLPKGIQPEPHYRLFQEICELRREMRSRTPGLVDQTLRPPTSEASPSPGSQPQPQQTFLGWPEPFPISSSDPPLSINLSAVQSEVDNIRAQLLDPSGVEGRYDRLREIFEELAVKIADVLVHDHTLFPSRDVFLGQYHDLVHGIRNEFLELFSPAIDLLARHVHDLSKARWGVKDIARVYGISPDDPRIPNWFSESPSLSQMQRITHDLFDLFNRESPLHWGGLQLIMNLCQESLFDARFPGVSSLSYEVESEWAPLELHALRRLRLMVPEDYSPLCKWQGSSFDVNAEPWRELLASRFPDFDNFRFSHDELSNKITNLLLFSPALSRRFSSETLKRWRENSREVRRHWHESDGRPWPGIADASSDLGVGGRLHLWLQATLPTTSHGHLQALFSEPDFCVALLLCPNQFSRIKDAVEQTCFLPEFLRQAQIKGDIVPQEAVLMLVEAFAAEVEHFQDFQRPRYAHQPSEQARADFLTLEHLLAKEHLEPVVDVIDAEATRAVGFQALRAEVTKLLSAERVHEKSVQLSRIIAALLRDELPHDIDGQKSWFQLQIENFRETFVILGRSLGMGTHSYPESQTPMDLPAQSDAPKGLYSLGLPYFLRRNFRLFLRKETRESWAYDSDHFCEDDTSSDGALYGALQALLGDLHDPAPLSLADLLIALRFAGHASFLPKIQSMVEEVLCFSKTPLQAQALVGGMLSWPTGDRATNAANFRHLIHALGFGTLDLHVGMAELQEARQSSKPLNPLFASFLFPDLAISWSREPQQRVMPGLLESAPLSPHPHAGESPPWLSFFYHLESFGVREEWSAFVSVKDALDLYKFLSHAIDRSFHRLLSEFLDASTRLQFSFHHDDRLRILLQQPVEKALNAWEGLVAETRARLAMVPDSVTFETPLEVILTTEALRRSPVRTRLDTLSKVQLCQPGAELPLGWDVKTISFLTFRKTLSETVPLDSPYRLFLKFLYEQREGGESRFSEMSSEERELLERLPYFRIHPEESRTTTVSGATKEVRNYDSEKLTMPFVNHLFEQVIEQYQEETQPEGRMSLPGVPELLHKALHIDAILAELDRSYQEYLQLPRSTRSREVEFHPTNGILKEFAGDICGSCISRLNFLSENASEGVFVPFVRGAKSGQGSNASGQRRLEGGSFVFDGTLVDGSPVLVIRGFNPSQALIKEVPVGELFDSFVDYLEGVARVQGKAAVVVPDDEAWRNALSNRRFAFLHVRQLIDSAPQVDLLPSQVSNFNNYPVRFVRIVRRVSN